MRLTTNIVALVALVGATIGCASTPTSEPLAESRTRDAVPTKEETMNEQIQALMQTYQRSLNEGDPDLVRSVYTEDAVFIGQPFPTATGVDDIVALYTEFLSKLDFNVRFEILEMELGKDLGFVRTQSVGTITPKGQTPGGTDQNREIFIVKKVEGTWKIHRYIFNPEVKT